MNQFKQLIDKVRPLLAGYRLKLSQSKLYQNKKLLLLVSIPLGLIMLTIVIGLIFGVKKTSPVVKNTPSPAPAFVENTNTGSSNTDQLFQIEQKLIDLKNQINGLDVKQSKLQPPTLNFNIKF